MPVRGLPDPAGLVFTDSGHGVPIERNREGCRSLARGSLIERTPSADPMRAPLLQRRPFKSREYDHEHLGRYLSEHVSLEKR